MKTEATRIRCPKVQRVYLQVSRYRNGGSWNSLHEGNGKRVVIGRYPKMSPEEAVAAHTAALKPPLSPVQELIRRKW